MAKQRTENAPPAALLERYVFRSYESSAVLFRFDVCYV